MSSSWFLGTDWRKVIVFDQETEFLSRCWWGIIAVFWGSSKPRSSNFQPSPQATEPHRSQEPEKLNLFILKFSGFIRGFSFSLLRFTFRWRLKGFLFDRSSHKIAVCTYRCYDLPTRLYFRQYSSFDRRSSGFKSLHTLILENVQCQSMSAIYPTK